MKENKADGLSLVMFLFFSSGVSALVYQVAWQRVLFSSFGVDLESVTVIVSAFMAGLGVGALLGGWAADRWSGLTLIIFALAELTIGIYGVFSVGLFRWAGQLFIDFSLLGVAVVNFFLVFIPTVAMGGTLPVLISFLARRWGSVGDATGILYSLNTIGASVGSALVGFCFFKYFELPTIVSISSYVNFFVALVAFIRFREWEVK
ncbi:hypothetical protein [Pseudomonas sp. LRF_L74]|uniref:hypothetical protein n=1 Tax=Pseudomonas sp. LRF_L74 TaxID=3369422 RepID=UPI003F5E67A5